MANTLTAVTPKLLAQGLMALREVCVMPMLVNRAYDDIAGERGSTIDVPIPSAITAQNVSPANIPPSTNDVAPTSVPIAMSTWIEAAFELTDKDQLEIMNGVTPMQASEAIKTLANRVNADLLGCSNDFYGLVGTPGTTPLASDTTAATAARRLLNIQLAPLSDRRIVMDPSMEANALNLRPFTDMSWNGSPSAILEGQLNRKLGFDWWMQQNVPTHTSGTITTGLIAKASTAQAIGLTAIVAHTAASTGATALVYGDVITFAGQTQQYVVTSAATQASANTDVTVNIQPPLQVALAGSEAITVVASHVNNLAFHRDAIAFATRPLKNAEDGLGSITQSAVDPISGLSLRLEITREYKRTRFSYDILYGYATIRRQLGVRIAG